MSIPKIRAYQPSDHSRCAEIFLANEDRGFVPPEYLAEFEEFLEDERILKLVLEVSDAIVGIGGIQYWMTWNRAFLSFGLIHPDFHRRGLGSILLLSRLVLLELTDQPLAVLLQATDHSRPFFEKVGFGSVPAGQDAHGSSFYNCHLSLTRQLHQQCADRLAHTGIVLPENLAVPIASEDPHFLAPPEG
jgi:GNAT superfamily N-acetyltransferase